MYGYNVVTVLGRYKMDPKFNSGECSYIENFIREFNTC
jgi:hypothetical protein